MSRWLHEELWVAVCPEQVMLLPVRRTFTVSGLRRTIHDPHTVGVQGATDTQPWRPALRALEAALPGIASGRTAATVVLSNQFLRYVIVPWQAGLSDSQEELSYARHCFSKVYGKSALQWELRLSPQTPEMPRLASGMDPELLDGLRSVFDRSGIALRSIQPHLMAAFNLARVQLRRRSAWLALLEPAGHLCLALLIGGRWSRVRSLRITWREELPWILDRESLLADDPAVPSEVYVGNLEGGDLALPESDRWDFHALDLRLAADSASAAVGRFNLAMAG